MSRTAADVRAAIIAEAYSWLRTPYVSCANVKGPNGGVDCAMLLVEVAKTVGLVPATFDPRPYRPDWHVHRSEELYLAGLEPYARRVEPGDEQPGDIALYRFGRTASHGAILVSDDMMIHAYLPHGNVGLIERASGEFLDQQGRSRLHSYWTVA